MNTGTGHIKFEGIDLDIEYEWNKYIPEKRWLSNGDPGYPAEGGEFYITSITTKDSNINIYELLDEYLIDKIIKQYLKNNEL